MVLRAKGYDDGNLVENSTILQRVSSGILRFVGGMRLKIVEKEEKLDNNKNLVYSFVFQISQTEESKVIVTIIIKKLEKYELINITLLKVK